MVHDRAAAAIALAAVVVAGWSASAAAQTVGAPADVPDPRRHGGWVTDLAGALDPAAEARIERLIDGLKADLTVEVAVVTVAETSMVPKDLATELFNRWGVGDRNANNGLLVLLVLGQRRLEMETGYGLEPLLPDGWLGAMQKEEMVPLFKRGDFGGGLEAGMQAVATRLRDRAGDARRGTGGPMTRTGDSDDSGDPLAWWLRVLLGFATVIGAIAGLGTLRMRRHRTCATCDAPRRLLDEEEDDAHLDVGQVAEEVVGSVNYHVWLCDGCGSTSVIPDRKWFSGYSRCGACGYKTMKTSTVTLEAPTRYSTGTAQVTETCSHCDHHDERIRTLPRLPDPSSSSYSSSSSSSSWGSSSSSSSWGGGSSGGGGAGSSW